MENRLQESLKTLFNGISGLMIDGLMKEALELLVGREPAGRISAPGSFLSPAFTTRSPRCMSAVSGC